MTDERGFDAAILGATAALIAMTLLPTATGVAFTVCLVGVVVLAVAAAVTLGLHIRDRWR